MEIRKAYLSFLSALLLALPGEARGDFLEEFSMTRALAYETLKIVRGAAPDLDETKKSGSNVSVAPRIRRQVSQSEINHLIDKKAAAHRLSPDLVRSVVKVESAYNVSAVSPKGAMGLMQLMPGTASDLGVINPWDPEENLEGGISYLASLLREFRNLKDALIAYNAGPEVVRRALGVPEETRRYVQLVLWHFSRSSVDR